MNEVKLGDLSKVGGVRDAIHMAVAPATAGELLPPGTHVQVNAGVAVKSQGDKNKLVGIVDPFLREAVEVGERFYLLLYPYTITSLRHDWTHPAFDTTNESVAYLTKLAEDNSMEYDELLKATTDWLDNGHYKTLYGMPSITQDIPLEFWWHAERVLGRTIPIPDREDFFSCSC